MPYADPVIRAAYLKNWREKNKDKAKAAVKDWKRRNPDRLRLHSQTQRLKDPRKAAAASKTSRQKHPEKSRASCRTQYWKDPVKGRSRVLKWAKEHPDRANAKNGRRRARKLAAPVNDFTAVQWQDLKTQFSHRCAYCGVNAPLTQDHVQPLSKSGSHTLSNILPACQSCHSRKGTKTADEFRQLLTLTPQAA